MKKSELSQLPEYFDRYINKCDDIELLDAIQKSIEEVDAIDIEKWEAIGNYSYAPGKWTIKDILQHLIDTERIFSYRTLAYARNETQNMINFPEDEYAIAAEANERSLEDLISELRIVHLSFKALFQSFTPAMLSKMCKGFNGLYSVAAAGFILPGHQRWHFQIIKEKYIK